MVGQGLGPRGILRDQGAGGGHVVIEGPILHGVDDVDAVAQHRDHLAAAPEGALDGGGIHAHGAAADHQSPLPGQAQAELAGGLHPVGAGPSGAHDGHRRLLVHQGQTALDVEDAGSGVELAQPLGILRVLDGEDPDAQPVALAQDIVGPLQTFVQQGLPDGSGQAGDGIVLGLAGEKSGLRAAEAVQDLGGVHPGGGASGAQPQPMAQGAHGGIASSIYK